MSKCVTTNAAGQSQVPPEASPQAVAAVLRFHLELVLALAAWIHSQDAWGFDLPVFQFHLDQLWILININERGVFIRRSAADWHW